MQRVGKKGGGGVGEIVEKGLFNTLPGASSPYPSQKKKNRDSKFQMIFLTAVLLTFALITRKIVCFIIKFKQQSCFTYIVFLDNFLTTSSLVLLSETFATEILLPMKETYFAEST